MYPGPGLPRTQLYIYIWYSYLRCCLRLACGCSHSACCISRTAFSSCFFYDPSVEDSWKNDFRVCAWAFETLCPSFFFVTGRHCQENVQASARVATACLHVMVEGSGSPPPHLLSSAVNPSSRQRHPMALKLVSGVCLYVRSIIFDLGSFERGFGARFGQKTIKKPSSTPIPGLHMDASKPVFRSNLILFMSILQWTLGSAATTLH